MSDLQQTLDTFYFSNGPCCAGCDWWRWHNSRAGECTKSAPMASSERFEMLGIQACSLNAGAGHALTLRDHVCGDFCDGFDWSSLPLAYRKSIGAPSPREGS